MHTHTHPCMHTCTHAHRHMHTCIYSCEHTQYTDTHAHSRAPTCARVHTQYRQTHAHACTNLPPPAGAAIAHTPPASWRVTGTHPCSQPCVARTRGTVHAGACAPHVHATCVLHARVLLSVQLRGARDTGTQGQGHCCLLPALHVCRCCWGAEGAPQPQRVHAPLRALACVCTAGKPSVKHGPALGPTAGGCLLFAGGCAARGAGS